MARARKVGGQISGGSTNLGRHGKAGTHVGATVKATKRGLGSSAMTNRNVATIAAQSGANLRKKAHS